MSKQTNRLNLNEMLPRNVPVIISGTCHPALSKNVGEELGVPVHYPNMRVFADGEMCPQIGCTVRDRHVFIIQPTCRSEGRTVNDNLTELCILSDAVKRGSPKKIVHVVPYYGYARQDKKYLREPITAKLVADFKSVSGADSIIFMDLHSSQTAMAFARNMGNDNLYTEPFLIEWIKEYILSFHPSSDVVIVSPDGGGVKRVERVSERLELNYAVCDKSRSFVEANSVTKMTLKGDVNGKIAIVIDDMIDTAGTACQAAKILKEHGATQICMLACHGIFSSPAIKRINESAFDKVVITNTLPPHPEMRFTDKIETIDISPLLAQAIKRLVIGDSITELQRNGICAPTLRITPSHEYHSRLQQDIACGVLNSHEEFPSLEVLPRLLMHGNPMILKAVRDYIRYAIGKDKYDVFEFESNSSPVMFFMDVIHETGFPLLVQDCESVKKVVYLLPFTHYSTAVSQAEIIGKLYPNMTEMTLISGIMYFGDKVPIKGFNLSNGCQVTLCYFCTEFKH